MVDVWVSVDNTTGKILGITYGSSFDFPYLKVPEDLARKYIINQRPARIRNDLRIVYKNNKIIDILDINKTVSDKRHNKFVEIPYVYKDNDFLADVALIVKSLDFKPVLEVLYLSEKELLSDPTKNKLLIHLTEKRNIHGHYQSFDIDLTDFLNRESIIFDIDRCDYQKLFSNDISFYYRKNLNLIYTIK